MTTYQVTRIPSMSISRYIGILVLGCFILASAASAESFCSRIETGSSMWLSVGSITTQMGGRFISGSADDGVELYNNVLVTEYAPGIPSQGTASAFIRGRIMEDGQVLEFEDTTSVIGNISSFAKSMSYSSKPSLVSGITPSSLFC
jgi:hypothetical protein